MFQMSSWKIACVEINKTVSMDDQACCKSWKTIESMLVKFDMTSLDELYKSYMIKLKILDVNQDQDRSKGVISQLTEENEELLNNYSYRSIKLTTLADAFVKRVRKDLEK